MAWAAHWQSASASGDQRLERVWADSVWATLAGGTQTSPGPETLARPGPGLTRTRTLPPTGPFEVRLSALLHLLLLLFKFPFRA